MAETFGPNDLDKLAPALVAACAEVGTGVLKDSNNPHIGNDYASLEAVLNHCKQTFAKHGLTLLQMPGRITEDNTKIRLPYVLLHSSGQRIVGDSDMPAMGPARKDGSVMPMTAQTIGSAITYGRRYQWMAIAGLAPVDDDGNSASGRGAEVAAATAEDFRTKLAACATIEATEELKTMLEQIGDQALVSEWTAKRKEIKAKKQKKD